MQACAGWSDLYSLPNSLLVCLDSQGPTVVFISPVHLEMWHLIRVQYFQVKTMGN